MKKYLLIFASILLLISCNNEKKIDLSQNKILVDPFSVAPLTAIVQITDPNAYPMDVDEIYVKVIGREDKNANPGIDIEGTLYPKSDSFKKHFFDITKDKVYKGVEISSADNIEIPVLGLYPDYDNKVFISIKSGSTISSDTILIKTKPLPENDLDIEINECHPELMEPGDVTWMTADEYKYDFMFDRNGEIRWFINVEGNSDLRILHNGNLLIRSWWFEKDFGEYTMLGESVNRWKLPNEYRNHHDIYEMPNGNFLVAVTYLKMREEGYKSLQDNLIEIDRATGEVVNNWDLFKLMDIAHLKDVWFSTNKYNQNPNKNHEELKSPGDWFHMNSFCYDEIKDEVIVSGKHGGVIKLSRNGENGPAINKNKHILWYMPMHDSYPIYAKHDAVKDFILTAVDSLGNPYPDQSKRYKTFNWMKFQHHPSITNVNKESVQFIIFDNVYIEGRSAIVEYFVDEEKNTVEEVWQYGRERKELFAPAWAGVEVLPQTDNRLMVTAFKGNPKVEVTKDKKVVFEYKINSKNYIPKWYRGGRIYLYPKAK